MSGEASVLIVIGNEEVGCSLSEALQVRGGYRTERARTGEQAVAKARERFFPVVVVGLKFPDMEWTELLRRLKEIHPPTKVIISDYDVPAEIAVKASGEGAFACLSRLVEPDELVETVRKALEVQQVELAKRDIDAEELIASIAHELRSPLTSIVLSADLLAEELPENVRNSVSRLTENIAASARKMDSWIQELLDLAKLRVGEYKLQLESVDFKLLLEAAAAAVQPSIENKGQSFTTELVEPLPLVKIDRQRMEQMVTKMLATASKSTPSGGSIVLRARKQETGLLVEIQDGAPPISEGIMRRLSYAYHRAETDKQHLARLGLGLALCRQLVALHGGKTWVDSGTPQGNVFYFTLPGVG